MKPTNNKYSIKKKLLFTALDVHAKNITPATAARRLKNLQNQAQALNMKLVPA